ncbi:hypothetical protein SH661x_004554 [Planctomicrobium sp. SH661]|uniref:hypothetical protein n=1 Tax=Planctomicrobium sp. SH661 TaxID=3448124 RepID=UPI003F5B86ED
MSKGELLTIWLVRISMVCYLLSLILQITAWETTSQQRRARWLWTIGYLFFLLHLAAAFHYVHHWSHTHAYEVTAQRTAETVGMRYGAGIYFNYAFMIVWGIDVLWWWTGLQRYRTRPGWITWSIQGFMAFIILNATIFFAITSIRWWGIAGAILLASLVVVQTVRRRPSQTVP